MKVVTVIALLAAIATVTSHAGCASRRTNLDVATAIVSTNKNLVYWSQEFLIKKGLHGIDPIDFKKSRAEEQPKLDLLLKYWNEQPEKSALNAEFETYVLTRSPIWLLEQDWKLSGREDR